MSRPPAEELADRATVLLVATVAWGHVSFLLYDDRWPRDRGLYYESLPMIYERMGSLDGIPDVLAAFGTRGGWYNVLLASCLRVFGRHPDVFAALDVFWVAAVVALTGSFARQLAGPLAGLAATAVVASCPVVILTGRMSWIHTPEAALVLGAAVALVRDPGLAHWRTVGVAALCAALALALRPSAVVWVATLLPLLYPAWRAGQVRRIGVVALACFIGALPLLQNLGSYMAAKVEARDRYVLQVAGLAGQLRAVYGVPVLVLGLVGLALALRPVRVRALPGVVLVSWLLVPVGLFVLFRTGLDNFPFLAPGLAVLVGLAFAERPRAVVATVAVFVLYHAPQYFGSVDKSSPLAPAFAALEIAPPPHAGGYYHPISGSGDSEVFQLLAATCPADPALPCHVAVDQGLFEPYSEDPGRLELFLGGWSRVRVLPLHQKNADVARWEIVALANFHCQGGDDLWRGRYPTTMPNLRALVNRYRLAVAWQGQPREGRSKYMCSRLWLTPDGRVARPQLLPPVRRGPLKAGGKPAREDQPSMGPGGRGPGPGGGASPGPAGGPRPRGP